jgi:molecular chaperone GrpE
MDENMKQTEQTAEQSTEPEAKAQKTEKKKNKKADAELAELKKQLESAQAQAAEANDKYLRMMAEYDNFRKRSAKEKEGIYADAYADCIAGILPVLDNLERAAGVDQLEGLKKGLQMTAKAFEDALEKMGIKEIETKTFDPNLHNAVMHVEDEALGESEIVEVFQKGYTKGDKVIRYAMVKVAN